MEFGNMIEKVVGSLDDKKRWRAHKERIRSLPPAYRTSVEALQRYLMHAGGITSGELLVTMLDDLGDLFERAAADGTPIRDVVGEDPVAFAEEFAANYSDGHWLARERTRLVAAIDAAAGDPRR